MGLQEQIQELEKRLALKKAYLSVKISFGKGNKIPQEIRDIVTNKIQEVCTKFANDEEFECENNPEVEFSNEERAVLKELSSRVLQKQQKSEPIKAKPVVEKAAPAVSEVFDSSPKKGILVVLDNIDPTVRNKIAPQSEVRVVGSNNEMYFVESRTGIRFWIPKDDLEI